MRGGPDTVAVIPIAARPAALGRGWTDGSSCRGNLSGTTCSPPIRQKWQLFRREPRLPPRHTSPSGAVDSWARSVQGIGTTGNGGGVDTLPVLSIYEGFFAGGARELHRTVMRELHAAAGHMHPVIRAPRPGLRESLLQTLRSPARCRSLREVGVRAATLGRPAHGSDPTSFTEPESASPARHAARNDIILSLKEQPL